MEKPVSFRVTIVGWSKFVMIVAARSHGHAKAGCYQNGKDAGYSIPYTDFRAVREKAFDELAITHAGKRGPISLGWQDKHVRFGCLEKQE